MNRVLIFFKKQILLKNLNRSQSIKCLSISLLTVLSIYSSFILDQKTVNLFNVIRFGVELMFCLKCIKYPKYYYDLVHAFAITSFIIILFTFEFAIVTKLKILLIENTILMLLIIFSIIFLMLSSEHNNRNDDELILNDYLFNNTLKPIDFKKSNLLNFYLTLSLLFAFLSLIYTSNLILTSVCYPKYYFRKTILLPNDCSFVYTNKQ